MLFSENKLRELASLSNKITIEEIIDAINSIGFEVESCKKFSDIHGIKFGYVLKTYKNKESDNLNVCEIEFEDKNRIIQTTANNVMVGDYLIAFIPGSGIDEIIFEAKTMKGIVSEGMLISLEELGFNKNLVRKEWSDKILKFNKISLNKNPIIELGLNDNIIDISILSNRSDANSYIVMSLELSAYFKTKPYILKVKKPTNKPTIKINSSNKNYLTGIEANIDLLKLNLEDIILLLKTNIKLQDDIYDLSSLTLIMSGVSSRVYDSKKIIDKIEVKYKNNFMFNDTHAKNALVVTEGGNVLSIAGVLESNDYKYQKLSKNVLFEFASFDPKEIRNSSRNLKISNDSSINSSKHISLGSIRLALDFMSTKLDSFSNYINDITTSPKLIYFDEKYLNKYAGLAITKTQKYLECLKSLNILGFKIDNNNILIPSYRHDINTMQDIVEEIFRFYGLNNFETMQSVTNSDRISSTKNLELICSAMGYIQFWTYTLVNKEQSTFNPFYFKKNIALLTYISEDHSHVRNSIALSLERSFSYNKKRKINNINAFDIGMINNKKALAIASEVKTYTQIKKDIFNIYGKSLEVKALDLDFLHPNYNAGLFDGKSQVGWIGKIHPKITKNNIIFAEIILDKVIKQNNIFCDYDNSPLKERDVTISLKENDSVIDFFKKINNIEGIYDVQKIDSFVKGEITNITFKIKMNDSALIKFNDKFNI